MSSEPDILSEWPWWFQITQEKIDELESMAAIGYTPEKIALYFDVEKELFMMEFQREHSRIRYHYERGILVNEAKEAIATQNSANEGNATQAQRLDKKRFQIMFQQLKERIIYGKE